MPATEERLLSLEDVANRLQVSDQTVRRWIKSGRLGAFKPGLEYRIRESQLEEFLRAREVSTGLGQFFRLLHTQTSVALQMVDDLEGVLKDERMEPAKREEFTQDFLRLLRETLGGLEEALVQGEVIEAKYESGS